MRGEVGEGARDVADVGDVAAARRASPKTSIGRPASAARNQRSSAMSAPLARADDRERAHHAHRARRGSRCSAHSVLGGDLRAGVAAERAQHVVLVARPPADRAAVHRRRRGGDDRAARRGEHVARGQHVVAVAGQLDAGRPVADPGPGGEVDDDVGRGEQPADVGPGVGEVGDEVGDTGVGGRAAVDAGDGEAAAATGGRRAPTPMKPAAPVTTITAGHASGARRRL